MTNSLLNELTNGIKDEDRKGGSLLDEVKEQSELQARAWMPAKEDFDGPKGVEGTVLQKWYTQSDYQDAKTGEYKQIPNLVVRDSKGENWGVRGLHAILRDEIESNKVEQGDYAAFLYLGQKEPKKKGQQGAYNYKVGVRKAAKPADGGPGF